jgi:5-formyltetrahydrofolate cyclo-ligase
VVATTVHPLQLLGEPLPETEHDFSVDLVVTPDEVIRTPGGHRPTGLFWDELPAERLEAMPVLAAAARRHLN